MPRIVLDPRMIVEWRDCHPTLVAAFEDVLRYWPNPSVDVVVTCIARTHAEDAALGASGIHASGPPWRALDFRITSLGPDYQNLADDLAEKINTLWVYDLGRPSMRVLFTAPHGNGPHGHLQVHPSTRRR